jgi:hypothetical protein
MIFLIIIFKLKNIVVQISMLFVQLWQKCEKRAYLTKKMNCVFELSKGLAGLQRMTRKNGNRFFSCRHPLVAGNIELSNQLENDLIEVSKFSIYLKMSKQSV